MHAKRAVEFSISSLLVKGQYNSPASLRDQTRIGTTKSENGSNTSGTANHTRWVSGRWNSFATFVFNVFRNEIFSTYLLIQAPKNSQQQFNVILFRWGLETFPSLNFHPWRLKTRSAFYTFYKNCRMSTWICWASLNRLCSILKWLTSTNMHVKQSFM